MDLQDYKQENDALKKRMADMEKAINELVVHNMQLSQQMDAYYDVRRRIHIYKELLIPGDRDATRGPELWREGTGRYDRNHANEDHGTVPQLTVV